MKIVLTLEVAHTETRNMVTFYIKCEFYIKCDTLIWDNFPCVGIDSANSEISSNIINHF